MYSPLYRPSVAIAEHVVPGGSEVLVQDETSAGQAAQLLFITLIADSYTTSAQLVLRPKSNSRLLVGAMLTQRPDRPPKHADRSARHHEARVRFVAVRRGTGRVHAAQIAA
jgi:hypothetical protein